MTRRPSPGNIVYRYGMRWHPARKRWQMHYGEDIGWGLGAGTTLVMPQRAQLIDYRDRGDWGMQARLRAGDVEHRLSHTARLFDGVALGAWLDEGANVAVMGATGLALGVHVHWEVLVAGVYIDPAAWLASTAAVKPAEPFPTTTPTEEEEEDMPTNKTVHVRLAKPEGEPTEWTLGDPLVGLDLEEFKGASPTAKQRRDLGESVWEFKGFLVTTDPNKGGAWSRTYARGNGGETSRTLDADYKRIQRELSRIAAREAR